MGALISLVEGTTKPLRLTVLGQTSTQAAPEPYNISGLTVQVVVRNAAGVYVKDTTAGITVTSATAGELEYKPSSSSGDLFVAAQQPYRLRVRLIDAILQREYSPSDEEALIEVNRV
jgi:hypothetical protein